MAISARSAYRLGIPTTLVAALKETVDSYSSFCFFLLPSVRCHSKTPLSFSNRTLFLKPRDLGFSLVKDHGSLDESERKNKEINNGRLAMIAALGMIVQELVTDQPLF